MLDQLVRGLGWAALILVAALAGGILGASRARDIAWPLAAAAIVLVVHAQVEMTLFQAGSVGWALAILGAAAWAPVQRGRVPAAPISAVVGAVAVALAVLVAIPVTSFESRLAGAERAITDNFGSAAPLTAHREVAAKLLVEAQSSWTWSADAADAAAEQLLLAAYAAHPSQRTRLLELAIAALDAAPQASSRTSLTALRSSVLAAQATIESDPAAQRATWDRTIDAARSLTALDPNGLSSWVRLGDVLYAADRSAGAAAAYRRALEIDAAWRLDPLRQLSDERRREITARAAE